MTLLSCLLKVHECLTELELDLVIPSVLSSKSKKSFWLNIQISACFYVSKNRRTFRNMFACMMVCFKRYPKVAFLKCKPVFELRKNRVGSYELFLPVYYFIHHERKKYHLDGSCCFPFPMCYGNDISKLLIINID